MNGRNSLSADALSQVVLELDLVSQRELSEVWTQCRQSGLTGEEFLQQLMRRELLTSYQAEKLRRGERTGYFYGNYMVQYLVGSGTFARVYRAVDRNSRQVMAVKVLRKRFTEEPGKTDQFFREGELGQALRHPNIVAIHDVHRDRDQLYIVMEFVEGQNLREFIRVRKKLDPLEATRITLDIAAGLSYALTQGLCHRDLKMSNVLVNTRGTAKLVDFGLAGGGDVESEEDANPRTVDYAGLERASGAPKNDPRSDLFFLGAIYYNLLTGEAPLTETKDKASRMARSRFTDVPPILRSEPTLPEVVATCVAKAMSLDPARRYQTPQEMAIDLTKIVDYLSAKARLGGDASGSAPAAAGTPAGTAPQPAAPARVLGTWMFVESNIKLQDMMREGLKKAGYRVLVIADPKRALARCTDELMERPDGVIVSTGEIGRSGLELCRALSAEARTANLPQIIMLGQGQQGWQAELPPAERRSVLIMPVRFQQVRQLLQQFTASAAKT